MARVLLTDIAWSDCETERSLLAAAGHQLIWTDKNNRSEAAVTHLCRQFQPAAIMTCWAPVGESTFDASPDLRLVQRMGIGLDNIAVAYAEERGVWVTNVPAFCIEEVSDHAIAMLLALARDMPRQVERVRNGIWDPASVSARRVSSLTVGIFGFGAIGEACARKLRGHECRILACNRSGRANSTADCVSYDELLAQSDVLIITAPLTSETQGLFSDDAFSRMRPGASLINVSRGALVDNLALIAALTSGQLSGAALDVVEGEPTIPSELITDPRVIITPHMAFSSSTSLALLKGASCEEVIRVLAGEPPLNGCNRPRGLV